MLVRMLLDEAGYEVLINTPDSILPSALYSEKAYILSKIFVRTALATPPQGLEDVIYWLYMNRKGPGLLRQIVRDSRRLQARSSSQGQSGGSDASSTVESNGWSKEGRISAGAVMVLEKHLVWLEQLLRGSEGG